MLHDAKNRGELAILFSLFFFIGTFLGFALSMLAAFDWTAFWTGLGALATLTAAYIVVRELPKIRRESAKLQVDALSHVISQLDAQDFKEWSRHIRKAWIFSAANYPGDIENEIVKVMSRVDYIALLIRLNYIDKELVFYTRGSDLHIIERALTNFEHRDGLRFAGVKGTYHQGYALLKDATEYFQRNSKEVFQRIDEDIKEKGLD